MSNFASIIAAELSVRDAQVQAAIDLLDGGATVPFIARYRKEATGMLDDTQLRTLEERLRYLREMDARRTAIIESIKSQGKMTPEIELALATADTKARLEDIYLPFKEKRRTKAQIAKEAGLEPLADMLIGDPMKNPEEEAKAFIKKDGDNPVKDVKAALDGARAILVERFAEHADLVGSLREEMWTRGAVKSTVRHGKKTEGAKFADYFDFSEPFTKLPSHRILAMLRGEKEEILQLDFGDGEPEDSKDPSLYENRIAVTFGISRQGRPADQFLSDSVRWAWRTRIKTSLALDVRMRLWQEAEKEAVRVFAANLRDLLLAAPAGGRATLGLDPGFRTGVKVAVIDRTGKFVDHATIYPHEPQRQWNESMLTLAQLCIKHRIELVAIGNGTASRETEKLVTDLMKLKPDLKLTKAIVSEAGASVYSASEFAAKEFPNLDVSIRGAVSIARRLQDPLGELVKVPPASIGVGQYQHDLNQYELARALDATVEDCVNAVGVDLNTASAPLLARVSGIGETLAQNIVAHRDANGPFPTRDKLKDVPRLGPKAFEQCAGFLRIRDGDNPLDASGVHPESYPVVKKILEATKSDINVLIGETKTLKALNPAKFADERFGVPTVTDIIKELEKPGRDPRPEFKTATFQEGVEKITDLKPGMILEATVTNVAAFGAFADIGVHQDGLIHISAMSEKRINDPREVVKPGQVVKVKVLDVDVPRQRISLTLRLSDPLPAKGEKRTSARPPAAARMTTREEKPSGGGAFAAALAKAQERRKGA
ncbi:putative transcriptional accessory protein containing S1 RNA-binding domain [Bradyrhizobium sp. ORS 285]|uniref:Tex family protein n=1 Tax=Bradyrhizobium sp. ORS 285 TaxID=115808 RepID=UPI0002409A4A|nr:Tex family protein [Bradyrhizobium sp. ORS 285]CCD86359.1 putative transcriptional accessory protein containing S1 RNA-binding domain [Bradyrhizobium sp. ORS 285]SMX55477.1 putative transcriptional accessory protein containing S1 RNA-binding domain [Bradyrhizobium sp. ORS 285]